MEKKVCEWNPLTQTLMEVLRIELMIRDLSTSDYSNLIVDINNEMVIVTTKVSGHRG